MNFNKNTIVFFKKNKKNVFFAFLLLSFNFNIAYSATVEELKDQIQKVTETKQQLQQEIAAYEKQLKEIGDQTTSLKNTIKSLDVTISKNSLDIKLTQNNINTAQLQIEELSMDIDRDTKTINQDTKTIASLLREVNVYDNNSFIKSLLTYKNLSELWNDQQNIFILQNEISEKITQTRNTKAILEKNRLATEEKKEDLIRFKSDLVDRKNVLDITKKEKNKLLADTKNSETVFKKMLDEKKALADAFERELLQFESELKFTIDPTSLPTVRKGIFSWPLSFVKITQYFGMTEFAKTGVYGGSGHNGIDFKAPFGTEIKTVASGIVKGTGDTDTVCAGKSYGKWILIDHNNGLSTVYAHLSLIKASAGQYVSAGDVIGYSGNTGYSTGPHLHLGVFASQGVAIKSQPSKICNATYTMPIPIMKGAYLDPLQYF